MRILGLLLAVTLALPSPAVPRTAITQSQAEAVASELPAFGAWLARLNAIHEPVQQDLSGFRARWQQFQRVGSQQGADEFRAAVSRSLTAIAAARAEAQALEAPPFDALDMPEDVHPRALRRNMIRTYDELHRAIAQFLPVVDAIGTGDAAASATAGRRLLDSLGIVLDTQVLLRRASLAATPREDAAWQVANVDYLYVRAAARLFKGLQRATEGRGDATLATDLLALAEEFDATARSGSEGLETQIAGFAETVAALEASGDRAELDAVRRAERVYGALRPIFPIARRMARMLREGVGSDRSRPVSFPQISALFGNLTPIRRELDAIARAEGAALIAPVK